MTSIPASVRVKRAVVRSRVLQRTWGMRARYRIRRGTITPGVTVVIVNWNSERFLRVAIEAIERFSSASDRLSILVVDNGSKDGSRSLIARSGVGRLRLPVNLGHEMALDLGFLAARTEFVVALDVDAFPLSDGWLHQLLQPLRDDTADVSGAHVRNGFVHPCCLAMRLSRFVERGHTFEARRGARIAVDAADTAAKGWDTGWLISLREPRRHLIERTEVRGPGDIASTWAGLVYHNFYSTRFVSKQPPEEAGVTADASSSAWDDAVHRYLGASAR